MKTLAVVILTKNEEHNIVDVIKNVRQCTDEILVVDSGSTDRTVELAERNGAKVLYRAWTNDFAAQRNFALDKTSADWILYIDADERLNSEAVAHIKKILANEDSGTYFSITRRTRAFHREFRYGALGVDEVSRLYPRGSVHWVGAVHEGGECRLARRRLRGYLEHRTYRDWSEWYSKMGRYSTIWAAWAHSRGVRTTTAGVFAHTLFSFFKMYVVKLGLLEGWYGLYTSLNHAHYTQMKYLKLLELQG